MIPPRNLFHRPAGPWRVDSIQFCALVGQFQPDERAKLIRQAQKWVRRANRMAGPQ